MINLNITAPLCAILFIFSPVWSYAQPTGYDANCFYYDDAAIDYYPDYLVEYCDPLIDKGDVDICGNSAYCGSDQTTYFSVPGGLYPAGQGESAPQYHNLPPFDDYYENFPDLESIEGDIIMVAVGPSNPGSIYKKIIDEALIDGCQDIVFINASINSVDLEKANNLSLSIPGTDLDAAADAFWALVDPPYECYFGDGNDPARTNINGAFDMPYWDYVEYKIYQAGEVPEDVDVLWVMQGLKGNDLGVTSYSVTVGSVGLDESPLDEAHFTTNYNNTHFTAYLNGYTDALEEFLENGRLTMFNGASTDLELVYLSDEPYAGYSFDAEYKSLMPPYDYWQGYGIKGTIKHYIDEDFWDDPADPFVMWGPYFWRRGPLEACYDDDVLNFGWICDNFKDNDGFHLINTGPTSGSVKGAEYAVDYFLTFDWFNRGCQSPSYSCEERKPNPSNANHNKFVSITATSNGVTISIISDGMRNPYSIVVRNVLGQQVFSGSIEKTIEVNELVSGYYFYVIQDSHNQFYQSGKFEFVK